LDHTHPSGLHDSGRIFGGKLLNRTPTDEELLSWKPLFIEEIKRVKPKVILALGACAAKTLLGWQKFTNMTAVRGNVFILKNGMKIVPSWHPAYLLRKTGDKKINEQVKNDLKLVEKLLKE
jgi:DNA polymerase